MTTDAEQVSISWRRGFPPETGMYLVELADGEHVITPYQADRRWIEADGDWDSRTGWVCLTHSRATVVAWAKIPKRKSKNATRTQHRNGERQMGQTFFEKWKHRLYDAWLVLTGRAWVGHGDPSKWEWVGTDEEWDRQWDRR